MFICMGESTLFSIREREKNLAATYFQMLVFKECNYQMSHNELGFLIMLSF